MFNQYPYINENDLNLDYVLKSIKKLKEIVDEFVTLNTITFADPITWNISTQYARNTVVIDVSGNAYLSKVAVPAGVQLNNSNYWLEIFNFTEYTRTANQNLTVNVETNTTRATAAYAVDDWLLWNDVLYKVIVPIAIDDTFITTPDAGANIEHFTVEDFIKAFILYATNLINQYKNDINASELAYRQQLAIDIADTTQSMQAQLNAAIAGATVDSEVINARVGYDGVTYSTLGEAIRTQIEHLTLYCDNVSGALQSIDSVEGYGYDYSYNNVDLWKMGYIYNSGGAVIPSPDLCMSKIPIDKTVKFISIDYADPIQMRITRFNFDGTFSADFSWIKQMEIDTDNYNYFVSLRKSNGTAVTTADMLKCRLLSHPHINIIRNDVNAINSNYYASANNINAMGWENSYIDGNTGTLVNSPNAIAENAYFSARYIGVNNPTFEFSLGEYQNDANKTFIRRIPWRAGGLLVDETKLYRIALRIKAGGAIGIAERKYISILSSNSTNISKYTGKKLSILGDSISTYDGYIPTTHYYYPSPNVPDVTRVEDTYWYKLMYALGMTLCVNNSYSGSCMSSGGTGTAPTGYSRATSLDDNGTPPDVIIIAMGVNDFLQDVPMGTYDGTQTFPTNENTFRSAYAMALANICGKYPYAEIYCATIMNCERYNTAGFPERRDDVLLEDFNKAIRELAALFGVKVLEHSKCGITYQNLRYTVGDWEVGGAGQGLHPNEYGHSLMANEDIRTLDNAIRIKY